MSTTPEGERTGSAEQDSAPGENPILADLIWLQETREDRLAEDRHLR
ncbi:hypothetical protein [Streptomyces sp. bgisy029]